MYPFNPIRTVFHTRLISILLVVLGMFFISCKTSVDNSCSSGNYDCADVCDGNYIIDNCDNCVLPDDTTCTADCAGVDGGSAQLQNYCTDQDNDGLGEPSSQTGFCNALVDEDSFDI